MNIMVIVDFIILFNLNFINKQLKAILCSIEITKQQTPLNQRRLVYFLNLIISVTDLMI